VSQIHAVDSQSRVVKEWVDRFNAALAAGDPQQFAALFCDDSYWRDLLALTWDFRTFAGRDLIVASLPGLLAEGGVTPLEIEDRDLRIEKLGPFSETIGAFFRFDTNAGHCRGFVRLMVDSLTAAPKAFTFLSSLQRLINVQGRPASRAETDDPEVLIIGAGHAGLGLAARLAELGISTVVTERNQKVGDNWRHRYNSLRLHNQLFSCHLPRLHFPSNWPMYMPKDMVGDFLGTYAEKLGLDVWTGAEVRRGEYTGGSWVVDVHGAEGNVRTVRPRYVVMATGVTGSIPKVPAVDGAESFAGTILHSSDYLGTEDVSGCKAVIIGAATSAHDIAQDLYHRGAASVTMVQRSSVIVVSHKSSEVQYAMYRDAKPGETLEDLDFVSSSVCNLLAKRLWIPITKRLVQRDKDLLDGLRQAGFMTDQGEDDSGFIIRSLMTYGQYYINVGASELIIEGKVQVRSGVSFSRVTAHEVILSDDSALEADLLVLATGFESMQEDIRRLFGPDVAKRMGAVWGMSEVDGELRGVWKPTAQPGFFVMGGGLGACRIYSHYVALQIQAGLQASGPGSSQDGKPAGRAGRHSPEEVAP
jgi:hypothetical protein